MAVHDKSEQVRLQIIRATDDLLYHKGYNMMSFSDIADASGVPRGNINYHFKTKQAVLSAVVDYRLANMKMMLTQWDLTIPTPLARLKRYAQIPLNEKTNVTQYGCPMGSLNTELAKHQPELQTVSLAQFELFRGS
jgi:AcrR family transcriptional regulator